MNISSSQFQRPLPGALKSNAVAENFNPSDSGTSTTPPTDSVAFGSVGETILGVGLMGGMGAVGIGGPAALALGSAKCLFSGHALAGVALGVAAAAAIPTVGLTSLGLAAMTTDSGSNTGLAIFGGGAALATAGAAWAMFG